jgi:hypothetical protein
MFYGDASFKGVPLGMIKEFTPAELGLAAVNMKVQAVTTGRPIDLSGFDKFMVCLQYVIVGTTPTVGKADIDIKAYALDGTTLVLPTSELITVSSTEAAGTYQAVVSWGGVGTASELGIGTITAATLDALKILTSKVEIILDVATASDAGTSHTGNVYLFASK